MAGPRRLENPYGIVILSLADKNFRPTTAQLPFVVRRVAAMEIRIVKPAGRPERDGQRLVRFEPLGSEFLNLAKLLDRLLNPAQRQQHEHRKMISPQGLARRERDRAPETGLR